MTGDPCIGVFKRQGIHSMERFPSVELFLILSLVTSLDNALAGVAIDTCFMLYILKAPAIKLIKAHQ